MIVAALLDSPSESCLHRKSGTQRRSTCITAFGPFFRRTLDTASALLLTQARDMSETFCPHHQKAKIGMHFDELLADLQPDQIQDCGDLWIDPAVETAADVVSTSATAKS